MEGLTISVVCGCMDRQAMLGRAMPSWLACPEIDEVVVVDWSSSEPVQAVAGPFHDARVRVARVSGQARWIASRSHNLGARLASGDVLLRLDADYLLEPSFFQRHPLAEETFYCGNWRLARVDNERHLTGALYLRRRHFLQANGYNERIVTYGYEDDDLFERLQALGLARRDVDFTTLRHIPHTDALRVKNQDVADVTRETARNQRLARARRWTADDRMTAWNVHRDAAGTWLCAEAMGTSPETAPASHGGDAAHDQRRAFRPR